MYDSMVFYRSFYEAVKDLPVDTQGRIYGAICAYGLDGIEPQLEGVENALFTLVKPQIDANNKRRESGRKGGLKTQAEAKEHQATIKQTTSKTEAPVKQTSSTCEANYNVNYNVNEKEKVLPNGNTKKKSERFSPPTVDDVKSYCQEKGLTIDAERFVNFYESKGWYVGKNKMKDWRSAVRGWASRERSERKPQPTKFTNFHERQYDDATMLNLIEM